MDVFQVFPAFHPGIERHLLGQHAQPGAIFRPQLVNFHSVPGHSARRWQEDAGHNAEKRAFARAICAKQAINFA